MAQILFLHQNFPGQFKFLAPALVKLGHEVVALKLTKGGGESYNGVKVIHYSLPRGSTKEIHPWVADFETKVIRAEAVLRACSELKSQRFNPDVIIAHPGWGESMFVKQLWPSARLGIFCEFYYLPEGGDMGFDPEFPSASPQDQLCRLQLKNLNNNIHFELADAAISPTKWQASSFPEHFQDKIEVIFDGVDTNDLIPKDDVRLELTGPSGGPVSLTRSDEVITFVNRNLEPMRGYHIFMRALPDILKKKPNAHVIIVGGNGVSYGAPPDKAKYGAESWREVFAREVRGKIPDSDWERIHFVGQVPYGHFRGILQLSTVHVYWTYPFVLSWSLIEAMSVGASIVASDTAPVREAIQDGVNGRLVDFFSVDGLVDAVVDLLDDPLKRDTFSRAARADAIEKYDLNSTCLLRQLDWVNKLVHKQ